MNLDGFCLQVNAFAAGQAALGDAESSPFVYIAPQRAYASNPFGEMRAKSDRVVETFATMASFLHGVQDCCHQFRFKYPLLSAEHAKTFAKVMHIKAQEAHRFVPVIKNCEFIGPRNLGFARRIVIAEGPIVQEHVLVDAASDAVIFIEESVVLPNGEVQPGAFAALNSVIEENGSCYFSGIYLYDDQPSDRQAQERKTMFRLTYENMIGFMESDDVELAFDRLGKY